MAARRIEISRFRRNFQVQEEYEKGTRQQKEMMRGSEVEGQTRAGVQEEGV